MKLILLLSSQINTQMRKVCFRDFVGKKTPKTDKQTSKKEKEQQQQQTKKQTIQTDNKKKKREKVNINLN